MITIRWKFSDYAPKTDYLLFNKYVNVGSHFKGAGSFCIEFHGEGGSVGFANFYKKWTIANDFGDKIEKFGKLRSITLRFGKPIISIYLNKITRNKAFEALVRYQIK